MSSVTTKVFNSIVRVLNKVYAQEFIGNLTGTADKAIKDGNGNTIVDSYATKAELDNKMNKGNYVTAAIVNGNNSVTIDQLYSLRKGTTGGVGSVLINKKDSGVGSEINSGWYHYFYIPHKDGIRDDSASYAYILLFSLSYINECFIIKCTFNAVTEVTRLLTEASNLDFGSLD